jgi:hypothetical protein
MYRGGFGFAGCEGSAADSLSEMGVGAFFATNNELIRSTKIRAYVFAIVFASPGVLPDAVTSSSCVRSTGANDILLKSCVRVKWYGRDGRTMSAMFGLPARVAYVRTRCSTTDVST